MPCFTRIPPSERPPDPSLHSSPPTSHLTQARHPSRLRRVKLLFSRPRPTRCRVCISTSAPTCHPKRHCNRCATRYSPPSAPRDLHFSSRPSPRTLLCAQRLTPTLSSHLAMLRTHYRHGPSRETRQRHYTLTRQPNPPPSAWPPETTTDKEGRRRRRRIKGWIRSRRTIRMRMVKSSTLSLACCRVQVRWTSTVAQRHQRDRRDLTKVFQRGRPATSLLRPQGKSRWVSVRVRSPVQVLHRNATACKRPRVCHPRPSHLPSIFEEGTVWSLRARFIYQPIFDTTFRDTSRQASFSSFRQPSSPGGIINDLQRI